MLEGSTSVSGNVSGTHGGSMQVLPQILSGSSDGPGATFSFHGLCSKRFFRLCLAACGFCLSLDHMEGKWWWIRYNKPPQNPFAYPFITVPSVLPTTLYHLTWQDMSRPSQVMNQVMTTLSFIKRLLLRPSSATQVEARPGLF